MYKLVIVDDEPNVVRSLAGNIAWQSFGYSVVGTATSGKKAFSLIRKKTPHVVLSDIVMPDMDGLDLMKKVLQMNASIQFVFLSAYDKFEYARTAMQYGIRYYLLKPYNADEISQVFTRLKMNIGKQNTRLPDELMERELQKNTIQTLQSVKEYMRLNAGEKLTPQKAADFFHISVSDLAYIFRKYGDTCFSEYLTYVRMERAKELLRNTGYRVQDIAGMLGYDDYSYFGRVFKKNAGITPLQYRISEIAGEII